MSVAVAVACLLVSCAALAYVIYAARQMKRLAAQTDAYAERAEAAANHAANFNGSIRLSDIERWREQQSKALGL